MTLDKHEEYLSLFKISPQKYLIGIYQNGITVYKQQVRALNIFFALVKTKKLKKGDTVGIIGGGIAGITFAAAAMKSNMKVVIAEKESKYLHLQHGCSIRILHPYIYDWPDDNAFLPFTELPVLNWKCNSADDVVKQILDEFEEIEKDFIKEFENELDMTFNSYLNATEISVENSADENKIVLSVKDKEGLHPNHCDIIIYAIGYGRENGISYWENDSVAQLINVAQNKCVIISGTGDGGVSDSLRLMMEGFNYNTIFAILRSHPAKYNNLKKILQEIKDKSKSKIVDDVFLYNEFTKINSNNYEYIKEAMVKKKFDRKIYLHGRFKDIKKVFNINKMSLLNAFLLYIAQEYGLIKYISGKLDIGANDNYLIRGIDLKEYLKNEFNDHIENYQIIKRYGTNRRHVWKGLKLSKSENEQLAKIKKAQEDSQNHGIVEPQFEYSDLIRIKDENQRRRYEFCTKDVSEITKVYLSKLYKALNDVYENKFPFRLSLHRVIDFNAKKCFQQITPYFGYNGKIVKSSQGRVFDFGRGNVGFSIKSGLPTLVTRENESEFEEILNYFNLTEEIDNNHAKSFLTLPILAPIPETKGEKLCTNLILFIEAYYADFFTYDPSVIDYIYSFTNSFVYHIDAEVENNRIHMSETNINYLEIDRELSDLFKENTCWKTDFLPKKLKPLIFDNFYSFNTIYTDRNTLLFK
ncbi:MAG: hypothetical protein BGO09_09800 [Bacteroidetes bacterium 47-18]|nr:MAG: hypothetical protein BGO09_09800 [Bacteroidetes bacterium 47-18]